MSAETILLVDDDEVLSQVLRRVLTREGYAVVEAGTAAAALQLAHDQPIALGLFDLSLPDGDGMDLARQLREQGLTFPVILMTAYPLRLNENPELAAGFTRVLTKPLNLQQVREAITAALESPARPRASVVEPAPARAAVSIPPAVHREPEPVARRTVPPLAPPENHRPHRRWVPLVVGTLLTVAAGLAVFKYSHQIMEFVKPAAATAAPVNPSLGARSVAGDPNGLELSPEVVKQLRIATGPVRQADATRPLVLSGSINYDPDYLARARPRFQGEVTEISTDHTTSPGGQTEDRALTFGDTVKKGELLAVVWCKDLGVQKGALADALNKLWADEDLLKRFEDLYKTGDGSLVTVNGQKAVVRADQGAVTTAERTLETWKVTKEEIESVHREAKLIYDLRKREEYEKSKQIGKDWPRVEVRAGISGTIVEKNVALSDIVDPTASPDLFKIADLAHLAVWAHAYEEDLRLLRNLRQELQGPIPWTVKTTDGSDVPVKSDRIDLISPSIDPNQHTALVLGKVDNSDNRLKIGQFVTATVQLPVPPNTVAVPTSALVEDGDESIVFVQPDSATPRYSMRRVLVAQRVGHLAYVRTNLTAEEKERGYQELKVGELVVTQRALELKAGLEDLQEKAQSRKESAK
jgi:cobalt-zinc-cadmium efflux system membrane fusion protein